MLNYQRVGRTWIPGLSLGWFKLILGYWGFFFWGKIRRKPSFFLKKQSKSKCRGLLVSYCTIFHEEFWTCEHKMSMLFTVSRPVSGLRPKMLSLTTIGQDFDRSDRLWTPRWPVWIMLNLFEFHPFCLGDPPKKNPHLQLARPHFCGGFPTHSDLVQHFDLGLLSLRQLACCPALAVTDGQRCSWAQWGLALGLQSCCLCLTSWCETELRWGYCKGSREWPANICIC